MRFSGKAFYSLFVLFLGFQFSHGASENNQAANQTNVRIRVVSNDTQNLLKVLTAEGFDVLEYSHKGNQFEIIASPSELKILESRKIDFSILEIGRPLSDILKERLEIDSLKNMDRIIEDYPDLEALDTILKATQFKFPAIAKVFDVTTTYNTPSTFENRHLQAIKISDNVDKDEDEPSLLIVSNHHAREIITPVIALFIIKQLTSLYATDPEIKNIVDNNEIWIAPTWNPDGYQYTFTTDNMWRKNRRKLSRDYGVDQNRNYPNGWDKCGGTTEEFSESYKGPSAGSEAETKAMMMFSQAEKFIKVLDFHSQGRIVLFGYACIDHPFTTWYQSLAENISKLSNYGDAVKVDVMGLQYQWQMENGAWAHLIETETEFQPPYNRAEAESKRLWPAVKMFFEKPVPIRGHIKDVNGNPLVGKIELDGIKFSGAEEFSSLAHHGDFNIQVPPGNYKLKVSAKSYLPKDVAVDVKENATTLVDVVLERDISVSNSQLKRNSPLQLITRKLNPSTTSISLYSLEGRKVLTLKNSAERSFNQALNQSAKSLPEGLYLFKTDLGESNTVYIFENR